MPLLRSMVFAAAALVAGCATMNVSSHVERGLDLSRYQTYAWGPADALPTGDPRLDEDPYFNDYMTGAIERELAARGYRPANGDSPQLLIHYHANVTERFEVHGFEQPANCPPHCDVVRTPYEQGTIVVDLVDTATNRVIWRGWAQDSVAAFLGDRTRLREQIDKAVAQMFQRLP